MKTDIYHYIKKYSTTHNVVFQTDNKYLYKTIVEQHPDLRDLINTDAEYTYPLEDIVSQYLDSQEKFSLYKLPLKKCSDSIAESRMIIEHFDTIDSKTKAYLVTNNHLLKTTLNALLNNPVDSSLYLENDFWIKTGECLFTLNNNQHIENCCMHPWTTDSVRTSIIHKTSYIRNEMKNILLSKDITEIDNSLKYDFDYLLSIHTAFAEKISKIKLNNVLGDIKLAENKVNPYDYIKIITNFLLAKQDEDQNANMQIKIISLEELPWLPMPDFIWVAGNSISSEHRLKYLNCLDPNVKTQFSYSVLQDCRVCHNADEGQMEVQDLTSEHVSCLYSYSQPCPGNKLRSNSFAINHITKLLNNPYYFYIESILNLKQSKFHQNHAFGIIIHSIFDYFIKHNKIFATF